MSVNKHSASKSSNTRPTSGASGVARFPGAPSGAGPGVPAPASPRRWPPTSRGAKKATRGETAPARRAAAAPAPAAGSISQSAGNARTRDTPKSQAAAAKAEPRPRRGGARGTPPLQRPARVNKASTHAAHLPGAAAPRPQSPGPPDQVKPDQRSLTGARRQRRRRADAGRARATYSGGAVPAAPEVFCAGASLPAGVGPRSPEKLRGC